MHIAELFDCGDGISAYIPRRMPFGAAILINSLIYPSREVFQGHSVSARLLGRKLLYISDSDKIKQILRCSVDELDRPTFVDRLWLEDYGASMSGQFGEAHKSKRSYIAPVLLRSGQEKIWREVVRSVKEFVDLANVDGELKISDLNQWCQKLIVSAVCRLLFNKITNDEIDLIFNSIISKENPQKWKSIYIMLGLDPNRYYPGKAKFGKLRDRVREVISKHLSGFEETWRSRPPRDSDDKALSSGKSRTDIAFDEKVEALEEFIALFAGSTGSTISMLLFLVSQMPKVSKAIVDEEYASEFEIMPFSDMIAKFPYSYAAILEVLRLLPVLPDYLREPKRRFAYEGVDLNTNDIVVLSVFAMQRSEQAWVDPLHFRPERHIPTNMREALPPELLTFSDGKLGCPGGLFARGNALIVLKMILSRCRLEYLGKRRPKLVRRLGLETDRPLSMRLKLK